MNAIYVHIDEQLDDRRQTALRQELSRLPHVHHVALNPRLPHDVLVEFEPHHNVPMAVLHRLARHGLHTDIVSC